MEHTSKRQRRLRECGIPIKAILGLKLPRTVRLIMETIYSECVSNGGGKKSRIRLRLVVRIIDLNAKGEENLRLKAEIARLSEQVTKERRVARRGL